MYLESLERLDKTQNAGPTWEFLTQQVWDGAWEFTSLTGSQMTLQLLLLGPHFKNQWSKKWEIQIEDQFFFLSLTGVKKEFWKNANTKCHKQNIFSKKNIALLYWRSTTMNFRTFSQPIHLKPVKSLLFSLHIVLCEGRH